MPGEIPLDEAVPRILLIRDRGREFIGVRNFGKGLT
jgi:hypothetical protein